MTWAAIFMTLAALGGATMAAIRFTGTPRPPTWLAMGHAAIAITGLAVLTYTAVDHGIPLQAQIAYGIFVIAALGGITIFARYHMKNLPLPIPFVIGHGLLALTGIVLLWICVAAARW